MNRGGKDRRSVRKNRRESQCAPAALPKFLRELLAAETRRDRLELECEVTIGYYLNSSAKKRITFLENGLVHPKNISGRFVLWLTSRKQLKIIP